jgi:hypothetical protein
MISLKADKSINGIYFGIVVGVRGGPLKPRNIKYRKTMAANKSITITIMNTRQPYSDNSHFMLGILSKLDMVRKQIIIFLQPMKSIGNDNAW